MRYRPAAIYIAILLACAAAALYGYSLEHGSAHNIAASISGALLILAAAVLALATAIAWAVRR